MWLKILKIKPQLLIFALMMINTIANELVAWFTKTVFLWAKLLLSQFILNKTINKLNLK